LMFQLIAGPSAVTPLLSPHMLPVLPKSSETRAILLLISDDSPAIVTFGFSQNRVMLFNQIAAHAL
jgi:hypothetical protein